MRTTELFDKNGVEIFEGNSVKFYHKGELNECIVIFKWGMFCLRWPDGYENKWPLDNKNLQVTAPI